MKSEVELGSHVNELDSFASELRNCVKVEVAVLSCPSLIVLMVYLWM